MPHDFDIARRERAEEDREFTLGGETFVRKPAVRPEVMIAYEDMTVEHSAAESLKVIDTLILAFLEDVDDAHDRYRALRARDDDAVNVRDLNEVIRWLIMESTKRPTSALSLSTGGRAENGTPSTAISSIGPAKASGT